MIQLSQILRRSFLVRLKSVREISQFFELGNGLTLSSRDKIILALNLRSIHSSFFKTMAVINKKIGVSYSYSFFSLYQNCFINLFAIFFLPFVKSRTNRFSLVLDFRYWLQYIEKTLKYLTIYDNTLKNCLKFKIDYPFSSETKLWFLKTIPFEFAFLKKFFFYFNFFNMKEVLFIEHNLPNMDLIFSLLNYSVVDLVRESSVLIHFHSLLFNLIDQQRTKAWDS